MNYLAHIYLAKQSDEAMLGALLGDFVKLDISGKYSREVEQEILMHRMVDAFTDTHRVIKQAKQCMPEARRRYAGILLDVFYDHMLATRWPSYSAMPIHEFTRRFYAALTKHEHILPENLAAIVPRMIAQDWLSSYQDFSGVEQAIHRISQRLSRNGHLLRDGLQDLRENYSAIADGFDMFFPELIQFVEKTRAIDNG